MQRSLAAAVSKQVAAVVEDGLNLSERVLHADLDGDGDIGLKGRPSRMHAAQPEAQQQPNGRTADAMAA